MELDELKNTWDEMGKQATINQHANLQILDKMEQRKFQSVLSTIILPEIAGSIVCIAFAAYIGFNFGRMDSTTFRIVGVVTMLLFVLLPALSMLSIRELLKAGDTGKTYAAVLKDFAVQKIKFCKLQKLNITFSYLSFVAVVLLLTRLFGRSHVTDSPYFFIIAFSIGYIILSFFSRWVFKSYNKTIRKTEELLSELTA